MWLLDTNVVSARRRSSPAAAHTLATLAEERTFISVMTLGEIMKGAEKQRRRDLMFANILRAWLDDVTASFDMRILPVSRDVALVWGAIASGRSRSVEDTLIAATAIVHNLTLVTRNTRDFDDLPLKLFNPWGE